jgi:hypothetical protein
MLALAQPTTSQTLTRAAESFAIIHRFALDDNRQIIIDVLPSLDRQLVECDRAGRNHPDWDPFGNYSVWACQIWLNKVQSEVTFASRYRLARLLLKISRELDGAALELCA